MQSEKRVFSNKKIPVKKSLGHLEAGYSLNKFSWKLSFCNKTTGSAVSWAFWKLYSNINYAFIAWKKSQHICQLILRYVLVNLALRERGLPWQIFYNDWLLEWRKKKYLLIILYLPKNTYQPPWHLPPTGNPVSCWAKLPIEFTHTTGLLMLKKKMNFLRSLKR